MNKTEISKKMEELKEMKELLEETKAVVESLQDEVKEYMTDNELTELFNDDKSIVARYSEVISNRFDSSAFKKSEWGELYKEYTKQISSMRFTLN